jgi:hypothetical protein
LESLTSVSDITALLFQIPASAVEMPGSADITGLNVQFGALEFGTEPSLSEFGSAPSNENSNQIPINLYPKSLRYKASSFLVLTKFSTFFVKQDKLVNDV